MFGRSGPSDPAVVAAMVVKVEHQSWGNCTFLFVLQFVLVRGPQHLEVAHC